MLSDLPLTTFGLDSSPMAYGIYSCDHFIETPKIDSPNYIQNIISICLEHNIDVIIPGTDDEVHLFSKHISEFENKGIKVIVAEETFLDLVRDKVLANEKLSKVADIFVKSYYNKSVFLKDLNEGKVSLPVIAKPGSGSGSLGIIIVSEESDLDKLNEHHIIQEIAKPNKDDLNIEHFERLIKKNINPQVSELSIHLVADRNGDIVGKMATYNRLKSGVPVEIVPYLHDELWDEIDKILPTLKQLGFKGPLNIQGRWTDKGLKIFEMNARFTGITGLRAQMGFNEVEACIKHWLNLDLNDHTHLKANNNLIGIRQTANKVVDISRNSEVKKIYKKVNDDSELDAKSILITGATGYLGRNLINNLISKNTNYSVCALVRDKDKAESMLPKQVEVFDEHDLELGHLSLGSFNTLLHLGFARPHKSVVEIAESSAFTAKLFRRAVENQVANIINMSSQSVYGQSSLPPWKEKQTPAAPNTVYASAKYNSELLLKELSHQYKHLNTTSIRLASTTGAADGLINIDLVSRFVKMVKNGEDITVFGGDQVVERIDVRDVILAIEAILETPSEHWKSVYNLGSDSTLTLMELAEKIIKIAKQIDVNSTSKIKVEPNDSTLKFGLDSSAFKKDFNWSPQYSIDDIITSLFHFDY